MEGIESRLRIMREEHDINQEKIAEELGITQQYYSQYECGKRKIPARHIKKLAEYYEVSSDYLLGLIEYPRPLERGREAEFEGLMREASGIPRQTWKQATKLLRNLRWGHLKERE